MPETPMSSLVAEFRIKYQIRRGHAPTFLPLTHQEWERAKTESGPMHEQGESHRPHFMGMLVEEREDAAAERDRRLHGPGFQGPFSMYG